MVTEESFTERRASDRSRLIIEIYFDGEDGTGIAHTRDIGLGGLYMNTQQKLAEGALIKLRIPFGEGQVIADARVIYSNPGRGVGVRFVDLSEESASILSRELPTP